MNEQIKKLAVDAGQGELFHIPPEFVEKFGELLLLECIDLVETTPRHCAFTTYDLGTVECTIQKTSERLHEHFGLKRTYQTTSERTRAKELPNARRSL